jgi:hypothetical protein
MLLDPVNDLLGGFVFCNNPVCKVRAVEARGVTLWFSELKKADNVLSNTQSGSGRQCKERHPGEVFPKARELAIFGSEVMTPFADTVGFVYRDLLDVEFRQALEKPRHHESLRCDVE